MVALFVLFCLILHCFKYSCASKSVEEIWAPYFIVPCEFLNPDDLKALKVINETTPTYTWKWLDVANISRSITLSFPNTNGSIYIPSDTNLLLLFNSSARVKASIESTHKLNEQFIQTSLPLGLPRYHYVIDLFLMVPKTMLPNVHGLYPYQLFLGGAWFDRPWLAHSRIPLTDGMLNGKTPVLMLVFRCADSLVELTENAHQWQTPEVSTSTNEVREGVSKALNSPVSSEVAKAVIMSSEEFFDNFARVWTSLLGLDTLESSIFCQVNPEMYELSYCLKIEDGVASIAVLSKATSGPILPRQATHTAAANIKGKKRKLAKLSRDLVDSSARKISSAIGFLAHHRVNSTGTPN